MKKLLMSALALCLVLVAGVLHAGEASRQWDLNKAKPLPYAVVKADKDYRAAIKRTKWVLRIVLVTRDAKGKLAEVSSSDKAGKEQLAATVVAAARYYAKETGGDFIQVILDSQLAESFGSCQMAYAEYAPDGRGVSGNEDWTWQRVRAAERGLTKRELAIQRLWSELRGSYQKDGSTDEEALKAAIGKKLGIPADDVRLPFCMTGEVPMELIEKVKPAAGQE